MKIKEQENDIILENIECFDVELSLFCGQAFRWEKNEDGSFTGTVRGKVLNISQNGSSVILKNTTKEDFQNIWLDYFDLERDYADICKRFEDDIYLKKARDEYYGIRVLNQEPWEALCSFIISQNNNIPRIKNTIEKLCEGYGTKIDEYYAFPSYEQLSLIPIDFFKSIGCGYRAEYLVNAIKNLKDFNYKQINDISTDDARAILMKIKGIGRKVADCILLFGFYKTDVFPTDTWITKVYEDEFGENNLSAVKISEYYSKKFGNLAGFAQQYMFYAKRK